MVLEQYMCPTAPDLVSSAAAAAELLPSAELEAGFRKMLDALPDTAIDAPKAPVIVSSHLQKNYLSALWTHLGDRAAATVQLYTVGIGAAAILSGQC